MRLPPREAETLKFLVHKHLLMSHLAFRRDTSDDQLIVRFAVDVGSPEVLRMLYVLTAADLAAVGPGVFNQWKSEVLADLYQRTMRHLAGDSPSAERRRAPARTVAGQARGRRRADCIGSTGKSPPCRVRFFSMPPERIADSRELQGLAAGRSANRKAAIWTKREPSNTSSARYEDITPGVFHKLTGGLSSQGLEILSADINTLADGLVLDRFVVHDPDFTGAAAAERLERRQPATGGSR